MADISMCADTKCPAKDACYRSTATPSPRQSYMEFDRSQGCHYLWLSDDPWYWERKQQGENIKLFQIGNHQIKYDGLRKKNKWTAIGPKGRVGGDVHTFYDAVFLITKDLYQ